MPTNCIHSFTRLTAVICCAAGALAQPPAKTVTAVPRLVKYSGTLADAAGKPLTGTLGVTFSLYADQEGGAPVWMENQNVEADANGQYTVMLGFTKNDGLPAEAFAAGPRWLGIHVQGEAERPRVLMASVPYSLKAVDAETLGGLPASAFALAGSAGQGAPTEPAGGPGISVRPASKGGGGGIGGAGTTDYIPIWTGASSIGNSNLYQTAAGNVGVGTTAPAASLEAVSASATGVGIMGYGSSTTGANYGAFGYTASSSGTGVLGLATAASGYTYGVYGNAVSPNGAGVWGNATQGPGVVGVTAGGAGYGVYGSNTATSGNAFGVYGATTSPAGSAVSGNNIATTGNAYGVSAQTASTAGAAVHGLALATSGATYGVYGETSSPSGWGVAGLGGSGTGVAGYSTSGTAFGTYGANTSATGIAYGVFGTSFSTSGVGVGGLGTASSGTNYGLYGNTLSPNGIGVSANATGGGTAMVATATGSGIAGLFNGSVKVTGNLTVAGTVSKGGGSFRIDHPLDPEHKYLYHSFVESPDMMNIYNGVVTLSRHGDAVVKLPDWFEALNRDFRYQLTCMGRFAPVYIANEVSGNEFKIAGGRPGMKVSWLVTGIRKDAFANEHRIPVEENKPAAQ
jgi:hypothetical protein